MPRGENLERDRKPGPGRPKGMQNRVTVELKQMIEGALNKVGGQKYLETIALKKPEVFLPLVSRLLPKNVEVNHGSNKREIKSVSFSFGFNREPRDIARSDQNDRLLGDVFRTRDTTEAVEIEGQTRITALPPAKVRDE